MFFSMVHRSETFRLLKQAGMFLLALAIAMSGANIPTSVSIASDFTITFEEAIPVPETVRNQYCNDPDTNQGVEFRRVVSIFEPEAGASSPTHAAAEIPGLDDVDPHGGSLSIVFTTGQTHAGVKVGLKEPTNIPMRAVLRAYSDPEGGSGTKLTPNPDPSIDLGTQPAGINQSLSFTTSGNEPSIRRIEIEFLGPQGQSGWEVIDDLTYSAVGPTCVTDDTPPSVEILTPQANQTFTSPQVPLHFRAQDDGSGIARIEVATYDSNGDQLTSGYYCGGYSFPRTCPGYPDTLTLEASYYTYLHRDTRIIRVTATDFSGKTGGDTEFVNLVLPDPTFNLWAMGVELTQGIQSSVNTSMDNRSALATQATQNAAVIPIIANKRTVLRLYPGIEDTANPVVGARATLSCYKYLGANLAGSTPCDGPLGAEPVNAEITVNPANNNDLKTLREDIDLSWNFILPSEWVQPGGPRYLVAIVQPPLSMAECGSYTSGCDDGANFFILRVQNFLETAPLIVKPHFACVRRSSGVPRENCDTLASNSGDALNLTQWLLNGRDWDSDGLLDPFFKVVMPLADGASGIDIRSPVINDYTDGDFGTSSGSLTGDKMADYLADLCDEFILDFWEIFTDPGELIAEAYPPNLRYLAFVPPPTGPSGIAYRENPCAVSKIDLRAGRIGDGVNAPENDYCPDCADDQRFVLHWDEPTLAQETIHTFDITHASCDHDEDDGGGCDPAPSVFPCPHGGICLSSSSPNEPYGFNTFNVAVLPPNNGGSMHTHDYMSYGSAPTWTSAHTYRRIFDKLRDWLAVPLSVSQGDPDHASGSASMALPILFVSGEISMDGNTGSFNSVYQLPQQTIFKEGSGTFALELQDGAGIVLSRRRFEPRKVTIGSPGVNTYFFEIMGFHPNTSRLVLKHGNQIIAERLRSPAAPTVQVLSPLPGEIWIQNLRTISWQGADGDGDPLVYTVQYSPDQGDTWTTLGLNLTGTSLQVNPALLPASGPSNARIRIFASDGLNSAYADSPAFTVRGKPPVVRIQTPPSGATFMDGELVDLVGSGIDIEDGSLAGQALAWASNLDGSLGTGHSIQIRTLSTGVHTITLPGQDSAGNTASASVQIEVLDAPNRQPLADAGLDRVVPVGAQVFLDSLASVDPDGDPLQYAWRLVSAPPGYPLDALTGPDMPSAILTASLPGDYVVELVVRDGEVNSFPDFMVIQAAETVLYMPYILH